MQSKGYSKKCFAVCFLVSLFCAAPVLAASDFPTPNRPSKPAKQSTKNFVITTQSSVVAQSQQPPLLAFADSLFLEKKDVAPQRAFKESKWSITPVLNRMTLSSLGDHKNFGVVWKYRF